MFFLSNLQAQTDRSYSLSLSNYSATATELVYSSTKKLSELIWKIDNVKLLGVGVSSVSNSGIRLNASVKKNISTGDAVMDDYDWLLDRSEWAHWSHHEDTDLTDVTLLELQVQKPLENNLFISVGYSFERTKWIASNGTYIYSSDPGFRDLSGSFSGTGITYIQEFSIFFAALAYKKEVEAISYFAEISRSLSGSAKDFDTHHLRDIQFDSVFTNVTSTAIKFGLDYSIDESTELKFLYEYKEYDEASGVTHYTDLSNGSSTSYGGAGIANQYSLLTVALGYQF